MIKQIRTIIALFLLIPSFVSAATKLELKPEILQDQVSGLSYQHDNYGNIWPQIMNQDGLDLTSKLQAFVPSLQQNKTTIEKAFLIHLPLEAFGNSEAIKKAGFTIHHATDELIQWKIQNGSPMPDPFTSIGGARPLFYKNGHFLAIEDKGLPGRLMFPGGSYERGELIRTTALREAAEEVNLKFNPEDCHLIGIMNRVDANRYHANDMSYYYLVLNFEGQVVPQESEVSWAGWLNLDEVLLNKGAKISETKALKVSAVNLEILQHLKNGAKESRTLEMADLREAWKPLDQQNPKDKMHLYLFAAPLDCQAKL